MSTIIRRKRTGEAWETVEDEGGGGGGDDLAAVLSNGNDAGGLQITNMANAQVATDAATLDDINQNLGFITFNLTLSNDPDAGGIKLKNIGVAVDPQDAVAYSQVQGGAPIADATDGTDVITQLNLLLAFLRARGDITT